jgi:hypothetical protein
MTCLRLDLFDGLLGVSLDVSNNTFQRLLLCGLVCQNSSDLNEANQSEEEVNSGEANTGISYIARYSLKEGLWAYR